MATFVAHGGEQQQRIGAFVGNGIADLTAAEPRLRSDLLSLIGLEEEGLDLAQRALGRAPVLPMDDLLLLPPVPHPPAFIGVGLNYLDHVREASLPLPSAPTVFNKQASSLAGQHAQVLLPRLSSQLDYEGELAVVVGRARRAMSAEEARSAIFGYTIVNDLSLRDIQFASPTVTMGKSFDTHGPCGPWIVTADEITDPQMLKIETRVNGVTRQSGTTADMIFSCVEILMHLSQVMTLAPGTIVTTGTPAGVGHFLDPPGYLRVGDTVEVEISSIGNLINHVVEEPAP